MSQHPATRYAVEVEGLSKRFGSVQALDGVGLQIPNGTVLGLLGPNGAGKTTTVPGAHHPCCAPTPVARS
jgi:ABC-type branched-subunit amino acid transport system ATPase component